MTIRVLLVDDQALVRTGFRMILDETDDIEVVGEAADGAEAVAVAVATAPDVILMDVRMPGTDGVEATRLIRGDDARSPVPKVIILTTYDLDEYVYAGLRAGASGFLLKDALASELLAGIRTVASGDAVLAPSAINRIVERFIETLPNRRPATEDAALDALTPREREILHLLAKGLSNAEIAGRLFVSEGTIKTHVAHILSKLHLRDRIQAVILAYETGLVSPGHA
jgi:DNA-binding NarL/FixJ family response regulator